MNDDSIISPISGSRKNLPMIVDISISNDGRQIYQVHDDDLKDESYNSKRSYDDVDNDSAISFASDSVDSKVSKIDGSPFSRPSSRTSYHSTASNEDENEVWGPEIEQAFEEAIQIIPKNGLSKIKVSGRSCGRNELISDFIFQQTGKLRTRKQVSSHIQVIKNLKKNTELITLINNGPTNPESLKKFEEVFSKITFQKSIGNTNISNSSSTNSYSSIASSVGGKRPKKRLPIKNICEVNIRSFQMMNRLNSLSTLKSKDFDTTLKLKSNANISTRFPGLFELFTSTSNNQSIINNSIPSIHGMCKVHIPQDLMENTYSASTDLSLKGLSINESSWSVLTVIYSFGQEIVRLIDFPTIQSSNIYNGVKNVDISVKFAPEFWNAFFKSLESSDNDNKIAAIRAITVKQIVFKSNEIVANKTASSGPVNILKKDIRSILLWEFVKVDEPELARTSFRKIHLVNSPQPVIRSSASSPSNITNQIVTPQPLNNFMNYTHYPDVLPYSTPSTTPVNNVNNINDLQNQEALINRLESPIDLNSFDTQSILSSFDMISNNRSGMASTDYPPMMPPMNNNAATSTNFNYNNGFEVPTANPNTLGGFDFMDYDLNNYNQNKTIGNVPQPPQHGEELIW